MMLTILELLMLNAELTFVGAAQSTEEQADSIHKLVNEAGAVLPCALLVGLEQDRGAIDVH
jgi:hypothetical protein